MIKRIIYLAIPVVIFIGIGLIAVKNFFSSFPPSKSVIEQLTPPENIPAAIDLTESFFDDSGSMRGYYGKQYIKFLRILKSHIREKGKYQYYAFSDPENIIEGDVWNIIEDKRFYRQNNTYFDKVLDSISGRIRGGNQTAKNFLIITDGIQDVSKIQDYSRIVNKVSDLLDAELFFQIVAIKLPFNGHKYPEGGSFIPYKGDSPLFCYIFTYQYDFGRDLYKKLSALNLPVKFLGFGNRSINASVKQFSNTVKNQDGSKNTLKKFRDEIPVTYLISGSGTGGTLLTKVALNVKGVNLDNSGFRQKTPEFCGKCFPIGNSGDVEQDFSRSITKITVTATGVEPFSDTDGDLGIEYSMFFKDWDKDSKTVACDLTLCNWLPVIPPDWVYVWSSDCDNSGKCFEGKTPFLINIINPILNKSLRKYTFGYVVIRN
ncbi:MAG: hypothetical protein KAJ34_00300 [Thermodesulfovibrionia bacterium]|nr:hypothetical protein [Thermodesulfovibrionia bacterium]